MRQRQQTASLPTGTARPTQGDIGALERLPKWLNLVPIVVQWLALAVRYRSLTLPSAANPSITAGGMVGEGKMEYLAIMGARALNATANTGSVVAAGHASVPLVEACMREHGLRYPVVLKPDLGWCGFGVRKVESQAALRSYVAAFPAGESIVVQQWLAAPGEAGLFYLRRPGQTVGAVIGILLRHFPRVIGDGVHTVRELIEADPRTRRLGRDGASESCSNLDSIPPAGRIVRVATVGSTRVGGRYQDGSLLLTPALASAVDAIAQDMADFHVGRFDVKFDDLQSLRAGRFTIIEVNGAGSEAVHAWDPALSLTQAYRIIFDKQRRLFAVGHEMRSLGHRPVGWLALLCHHLRQQRLIRQYPPSN